MESEGKDGTEALASPRRRSVRKVSYAEICQGIDLLCDLIWSSPDGWRPDAIVAVVQGGLVPATHLCHFFDCPLYFIYNDRLLNCPARRRNVLVVDEINDSGSALRRIRDEVFGSPTYAHLDVRYAVLYTRHTTKFRADYSWPPNLTI